MNNIYKLIAFISVLFFCASVSVRADEIDSYVKAEMQRQKIPGVSLAVLRNGKIVTLKSYGLANVEH